MKSSENHISAGHLIGMVFAVMGIVYLFFSIIVGDKGISSLQMMKNERRELLQVHAELKRKNIDLFHEIERLKNDPVYIEAIARKDLGLIGKNEIVINMSNVTTPAENNR